MYQAIVRQPQELQRLLADGWTAAGEAAARLLAARRIYTIGNGTSFHAAVVGAWLLRAAGSDARAVSSFDFALYPESAPLALDDAVIVMAHTGTRTYSTRSLERAAAAGAPRLSVGSFNADHPDSQLVLRTVERERSAAYTVSHLAAMTVLAQIVAVLGEQRRAADSADFRAALMRLPEQVEEVLARRDEIEPLARAAADRRIYVAGAGPNEATALEAVIKVREAAQGWIDALALEQFLHGPIVGVQAGDQAILINVPGRASERIEQIARLLAGMGARLWLIGGGIDGIEAAVSPLPALPELLSPLLAVVPLQLFACFMAGARHINPDIFRRDDERFAAAFAQLRL